METRKEEKTRSTKNNMVASNIANTAHSSTNTISVAQMIQTELAETMASVKDNSENIDDMDADIEALKRRNIRLEAYTRRENIRIYNVEEVAEEKTEEVVRNLLIRRTSKPFGLKEYIRSLYQKQGRGHNAARDQL